MESGKIVDLGINASIAKLPVYTPPPNPSATLKTIAEANLASEFYNRLVQWINKFNEGLDNEHEVGVRLVNFGQTITFHLKDISYWNPSLIMFQGHTESNEPVELIQHTSQISILLMKLPRRNPESPKSPIGFCTNS
jgi:Family of unknown function (DUF6173)